MPDLASALAAAPTLAGKFQAATMDGCLRWPLSEKGRPSETSAALLQASPSSMMTPGKVADVEWLPSDGCARSAHRG